MTLRGSGLPVELLRPLLAKQGVADDRAADVAEGLRRDLDLRVLDDREARVVVAAVEGERGEDVADHPRGAHAVARVAEDVMDAFVERADHRGVVGRDVDRPAPRVGDPPSLELREEAGEVGRDLGGDVGVDLGVPAEARAVDHPPSAPAEGDPPVVGGAEVMEHVAAVGDAFAARPADLLDDVGHRLGDHHVTRRERQAPPERLDGLLRSARGEHGVAGAHDPAVGSRLDSARARP